MVQSIQFIVKANFSPPPFIGSMVRGALGQSLKEVVCVNPSFECEGCFAQESCLYYDMYEAKKRFHDFRLDFELWPKSLEFGIRLWGEAKEKYPYILSALHRVLSVKGLGTKRERVKNFKIWSDGEPVYDGKSFIQRRLEPKSFQIDTFCPEVTLRLRTPVRLKKDGRFLRSNNLGIEDLLISIARKRGFYEGKQIHIETFPKVEAKELKMIDFTRYSSRQKSKMRIGGVIGWMRLRDLTPQTYELLRFGEIVGVGKLGTFGLGSMEVKEGE